MAELETAEEEYESLFGGSNPDLQTILLMRIYDVLMADFIIRKPEEGSKLYDKHKAGGLVGPQLGFNPEEML